MQVIHKKRVIKPKVAVRYLPVLIKKIDINERVIPE
jgi:hypothetical protein